MVMLTRGWAKFLVLVGFVLELFGALVPTLDDEPAESERASAVQTQSVEQAPPPASMPIGNRAVYGQPQMYHSRYTPQDDTWWMQMPAALRDLTVKQNPAV